MNLNGLIESLGEVVGCPVAQDFYSGKSNKYICFTYEDERPALSADDEEEYEQAYMAISLYTPATYNYFADKKKIKRKLVELGFYMNSIQSFVRDDMVETSKIRQTIFSCYFAGKDEDI